MSNLLTAWTGAHPYNPRVAKSIHCAKCYQEITDPHDLMVVAKLGLVLRPYHTSCYGEVEKTLAHRWVNHRPDNVDALLGLLLGLLDVLSLRRVSLGATIALALLGFWPVVLRVSSYVLFERPLRRKHRPSLIPR